MRTARLVVDVFALLSLALLAFSLGMPTAMAANYPALLDRCVELIQGEPKSGLIERGWAAPISPRKLVTSRHVSSPEPISWLRNGRPEQAAVLWRSKGEEVTALATLVIDESLAPIPLATETPKAGDRVFYKAYIKPGWVPTVAQGWVLGIDSTGQLQIDGTSMPGTSGSCVVNEAGELVGTIATSGNPVAQIRTGKIDLQEFLSELSRRSMVRPITYAVPVSDFPKEARP